MSTITIALSKGRIFDETAALLKAATSSLSIAAICAVVNAATCALSKLAIADVFMFAISVPKA